VRHPRIAGFAGDLLTSEADLLAYSYDSSLERGRPDAVAVARRPEDVQAVVRWCLDRGVPYVVRGAGTNLSGGCVALRGGVVLSLERLDRILTVDTQRDAALVEPGVINLKLQDALAAVGRFYGPDPASYKVCTIGGNVGENAGGPRCLRYGVTTNHVLRLDVVMPDGSLESLSGEDAGPELMSLLIGSEGTLGVAVRALLGILPAPEAVATALAAFPTLESAMAAVADIIASGILPRDLEAMDRTTVETISAAVPADYPHAEAVLLLSLEGTPVRVRMDVEKVRSLCEKHGCVQWRLAADEGEALRLWEGRRSAYASLARVAPSILVEDGVVPRHRLPEAARRVGEIAREYKVRASVLFHAGDGNLHPNIVFDERDRPAADNVRRAGLEMLKACVELGGSISGEHGIGVEKRAAMGWLYGPESLGLMGRIKKAFDPADLANPDKILPLPGETAGMAPLLAKRPLSEAARALAAAVKEKALRKQPVDLVGLGTRAPRDGALDTAALTSILDLDRANYTLTVEAGIRLSDLKAAVDGEGFFAPVPIAPGTLGGLLATKAWPGVRDHVLGMRLLLADGGVAEFGGKTVKNVAGYDIPRLMLGSWGTLAVILDVTLRLLPHRIEVPDELPAPVRPRFDRWHALLKGAFDPDKRLNRWVQSG